MRFLPLLATAASVAAVSVCGYAAEAVKAVPAASLPAGAPSAFALVQVFFALVLVIGAILLTAWLMRRFSPGQFGNAAQLRVVGGVMVGAKERVVVVELRDTWLVLGVTPNEVSTLHTLPRPDDLPPAASAPPLPFAEKLAAVLKARQAGKGGDAA
ncbi:flagellar biosynthetic protein FliO [Chitinimonas koreensis]|uniref:flagellar biosynthetic protein FliO n=1 Tax=Chitinimonas koreensis TaxID=356302 RepID=UPI0003F9C800|nr:flagellar biosynthetic protein FliO [Chitinimonas koreensis]QNM98293.1 flagellar biosynthetic protein FliO [Chitinimonas koreensis]